MEWLDDFRLHESQREDEEVGNCNINLFGTYFLCIQSTSVFRRILMASWIGGALWNVS